MFQTSGVSFISSTHGKVYLTTDVIYFALITQRTHSQRKLAFTNKLLSGVVILKVIGPKTHVIPTHEYYIIIYYELD